ncbi:M16 family metallopeptidase [Robiginitalea sp.]|uniref:M16 family metallopeptidase n=1 Tax=Robiginitalea sp. TaxID=1902411 RepID=UPI003C723C8F
MKTRSGLMRLSALLSFLVLLNSCETEKAKEATASKFEVPVTYYTLENGLKVILSEDTTSPTAIVAVYYNIGFRNEPRDRTGFAHLFEHMMFQGSDNLGKMEFIKLVQENGGVLNGSTRFDFTNYFEIVPSHKLETMLWAEADRMKGLSLTQESLENQQGVVKNEVKVNVLNQPYGGFPWLDMPQYANENWYNAHNFYGDLKDLDAANLEDVTSFFDTFYSPNNAAISVVGDIDIAQTKAWIETYFGSIPAATLPPEPDISEARQEKEKYFMKNDSLANKPALAFAYHMPERNTPEYYAMGLLDQILIQGDNSLLVQKLENEMGFTSDVSGGINYLGNMFNYKGPMLWMYDFTFDNPESKASIMESIDTVMIELKDQVDRQMLDQAIVKIRSQLYDDIGGTFGLGRADLLCSFALFDDNPGRINSLEEEFKKVDVETVKRTIDNYLRASNRTVLEVNPLLATNEKIQ